jgi:hypothetical protein
VSVFREIVTAIHEKLDDSSVHMLIGRKHLKESNPQRRVVWARRPSQVVTPSTAGGKLVKGATTATDARVSQIYTLEQACEAHIYAEDEDAVEALFSNLLIAQYAVLNTGAQRMLADWETDTQPTGVIVRGEKIRLDVTWLIPLTNEPAKLTPIENQTHVGSFENVEGTSTEVVC